MNTFQIVGFILLGIIVFLFLISYIAIIREWNHIKSGDKGIYTDGFWISGEFTVIHKTKNFIIIKYFDDTTETILKDSYIDGIKSFTWHKNKK